MPSEIENPVIYYDPVTKAKYTEREVQAPLFSARVLNRLITRIMYRKGDKKVLLEIPEFYEVPPDMYESLQQEFEIVGGTSESLFEIWESYPELLLMQPVEGLDWSPISDTMYHTKEHFMTPTEKKKFLTVMRKKFKAKHPDITHVIPDIYLYYRKHLKGGREGALYRKKISFKKFTTTQIRKGIITELDKLIDVMTYYYVVAERPSYIGEGKEYRTILKRVSA